MHFLKSCHNYVLKTSLYGLWASSQNANRMCSQLAPIKMAFDVYGSKTDKPPLIIMHGLFGQKQNWRGISRALEAKLSRKVYSVDARNHGDSPHTDGHSSVLLAADVAEFIKSEGIGKACVMGHSMGGRAMMHLAIKYPELVHRGIIVDISPISVPRDFFHMHQLFAAMQNISVAPELSMAQGRAVVETQIKAAVEDQATVDFILLNLRKAKSGEFYWTLNVKSLGENLRKFADFDSANFTFRGPMMFICGNKSNFVDPEHWPGIQKIFPNAIMHWLDAGHLVHFDQPNEFLNLVVTFLEE